MFDNLKVHSKATDQEMTAVEKFICFSQILKGRGMPHPAGPYGEAPAWSGGRNEVPEV